MAVRRKKDTTGTGAGGGPREPKKPAARKRVSTKTATQPKAAVPVKRTQKSTAPKSAAVEELENVGADVVPTVTIRADVEAASMGDVAGVASTPDAALSEGGPIGIVKPVVESAAIREHTIDQIEPEVSAMPSSLLSDWDLHLFNEGTHQNLWEKLGAHLVRTGGHLEHHDGPERERAKLHTLTVVGREAEIDVCEPDPRALADTRLEHPLDRVARDAAPVVAHGHAQPAPP